METRRTGIPIKYKFYIRIFVATFLGWVIPHVSYSLYLANTDKHDLDRLISWLYVIIRPVTNNPVSLIMPWIILSLITGVGVGFCMAFTQWIALRLYLESVWIWMSGVILIWIAASIFDRVLYWSSPVSHHYAEYVLPSLKRIICVGLATGFCIGILQQILLQKRTGIRFWWGLAGFFGVFGGLLFEDSNLAGSPYFFPSIDPIYASTLAALVFAGFASLPALLLKNQEVPNQKALVG